MKVCFASIISSPVCTLCELSEMPTFKDTHFSCRVAVNPVSRFICARPKEQQPGLR